MRVIRSFGLQLVQLLDPETAHTATIAALKTGLAGNSGLLSDTSLETVLPVSGLRLPNPIGLAAGFDKNAEVHHALLALGFGFVECGTVTPKRQPGNPKPRLFRLKEDSAVINRMGFNNAGLKVFVSNLKRRRKLTGIVGANVGANKLSEGAARIQDYEKGIRAVWNDCDYITLNISSPNTPGLRGLQNGSELTTLLIAASETIQAQQDLTGVSRPVFLKIAPDLDETTIRQIVDRVVAASGLTGMIVSNTTISRPNTLISAQQSETGGLSGKPLFDLSTTALKIAAAHADGALDMIGVGGVHDLESAYAKLEAGAHAVQLYSALVYDGASVIEDIVCGLVHKLKDNGYTSMQDFLLHRNAS